MAKENVQKFFDKVAKDEGLKTQLQKASIDSIIAVANQAGFDFTAEEFTAVWNTESNELSDEALAAVAGGGFVAPMRLDQYSDDLEELDPAYALQIKKAREERLRKVWSR